MSKTRRILAGALACLIVIPGVANAAGQRAQVTCLGREQAAKAIIDDSLEPYFDQLQPMEMSAKTGAPITGETIDAQRAECRKRYQAGALSFTEAEKTAIQFYVDKVSPILIKDYPAVGEMPWSFLKVSDSIEGGLPHTRGKHIVLSESMCKQMTMVQQMDVPPTAHVGMFQLFVHEQFHVFQRTHPGLCDSLYTDVWGFVKATSTPECKWLVTHHLANPDAVDCPWILPIDNGSATQYLWPLVVFAEGPALKRMPHDFSMLAISLTKQNNKFTVKMDGADKPVSQDLRRTAAFRKLFPLSSNIYHPHEASADMFGTIVIVDNFIPADALPPEQKEVMTRHLASFRKWLLANTAKSNR